MPQALGSALNPIIIDRLKDGVGSELGGKRRHLGTI